MTVYFNPRVKEYEAKHICIYCGKELKSPQGKTLHEKSCSLNPDNINIVIESEKDGE